MKKEYNFTLFKNIYGKWLVSAIAFLIFMLIPARAILPEEIPDTDLNVYYRFPFSFGLEYQSYSYSGLNKSNNDIFMLTFDTRWPLANFPQFQPSLELGIGSVDNLELSNPQRWDHKQYQALVGMVYANHFSKNFEYGLEISGGANYMLFPDLLENEQTFGSISLVGQTGFYVSLVPNYNFTIAFHPLFKYFYSLTPLNKFDGPVLGAGISVSYRFGEDPDLPKSHLDSLDCETDDLPPVYANMHHYYKNHPLGKLVLTNKENYTVKDLEVYFFQKTYLDSPTLCERKPELKPGENWAVDIYAIFNNRIFEIEGSEPVSGEITITYKALGRRGEKNKPVSFELNDKTTITWDDYHKVAALITSSDSALKNYSSFIQRNCEKDVVKNFNQHLQLAMQLYAALTELNVVYQPDPVLPFSMIKPGEKTIKDTVYLARDTLKRGSGDCDDLTVLFCSLLESAGIESGYLILPGHILPVFNAKLAARSFADLHPDRAMTIQYNDELWIPVEITALGKSDFLSAWQKGIDQYEKNMETHTLFITRQAQELYQPVSLKEKDLGLQYGNLENIRQDFKENLSQAINRVLSGYEEKARNKEDKESLNTLGAMYGSLEKWDEAENTFKKALALDENYLFARINVGIILIQKKDYSQALDYLRASAEQFSLTHMYPELVLAKIYFYLSQCYRGLAEAGKAQEFLEQSNRIARTALAGNGRTSEKLNAEQADTCRFLLEQDFIPGLESKIEELN